MSYIETIHLLVISVLEMDKFCRYCGAYRQRIPLNSMGLCDICETKKTCASCNLRRQNRFFQNNSKICTTCIRNDEHPIRRSVRNTFEEQLLDPEPKSLDVGVVIRDLEDDITSRLEQQLTEQGFEEHFNFFFLIYFFLLRFSYIQIFDQL